MGPDFVMEGLYLDGVFRLEMFKGGIYWVNRSWHFFHKKKKQYIPKWLASKLAVHLKLTCVNVLYWLNLKTHCTELDLLSNCSLESVKEGPTFQDVCNVCAGVCGVSHS